jgi:hypothetical protein
METRPRETELLLVPPFRPQELGPLASDGATGRPLYAPTCQNGFHLLQLFLSTHKVWADQAERCVVTSEQAVLSQWGRAAFGMTAPPHADVPHRIAGRMRRLDWGIIPFSHVAEHLHRLHRV